MHDEIDADATDTIQTFLEARTLKSSYHGTERSSGGTTKLDRVTSTAGNDASCLTSLKLAVLARRTGTLRDL